MSDMFKMTCAGCFKEDNKTSDPCDECMSKHYRIHWAPKRTEEQRKQFLKEQDGWTDFSFEEVMMFGKKVMMTKCNKCSHLEPLAELLTYLAPVHCVGCGRTTMVQDRYLMKAKLEVVQNVVH